MVVLARTLSNLSDFCQRLSDKKRKTTYDFVGNFSELWNNQKDSSKQHKTTPEFLDLRTRFKADSLKLKNNLNLEKNYPSITILSNAQEKAKHHHTNQKILSDHHQDDTNHTRRTQ